MRPFLHAEGRAARDGIAFRALSRGRAMRQSRCLTAKMRLA
jgi:hypothetical protein